MKAVRSRTVKGTPAELLATTRPGIEFSKPIFAKIRNRGVATITPGTTCVMRTKNIGIATHRQPNTANA